MRIAANLRRVPACHDHVSPARSVAVATGIAVRSGREPLDVCAGVGRAVVSADRDRRLPGRASAHGCGRDRTQRVGVHASLPLARGRGRCPAGLVGGRRCGDRADIRDTCAASSSTGSCTARSARRPRCGRSRSSHPHRWRRCSRSATPRPCSCCSLMLGIVCLQRRRYGWLYAIIPAMAYLRPGVLAFALLLGLFGIWRWRSRPREPLRRHEARCTSSRWVRSPPSSASPGRSSRA